MTIYWVLLAYFVAGAVLSPPPLLPGKRIHRPLYVGGALLIVVIVGLRYEVGADWIAYQGMLRIAGRSDLWTAMGHGDPGYMALNWAAHGLGLEIWAVNLVCAIIFTWGLYRFCSAQPRPWLAVLFSVPYFVIVTAMGYTRQGVALGILMAGMAAFVRNGSTLRFAVYVAIAALFHRSAVFAFPLVALSAKRNRFINFMIVVSLSALFYDVLLGDAMDKYMSVYIQREYSSGGAALRAAINLVAALGFWAGRNRTQFTPDEASLWKWFSMAALGLALLLPIFPSSTAVDRLALYVMPLQLAIAARAPFILRSETGGKMLVVAGAIAIQFVWIVFASHAESWIPYQFFPGLAFASARTLF